MTGTEAILIGCILGAAVVGYRLGFSDGKLVAEENALFARFDELIAKIGPRPRRKGRSE